MEILAIAATASVFVGLLSLITINIMYPMGRKRRK